jgi:hypothetical protein
MTTQAERDDSGHYHFEGRALPSVTKITGEWPGKRETINNWKARTDNPEQVKNEKALLGTLAHRKILSKYAIRELPIETVKPKYMYDGIESDVETVDAMWQMAEPEIEPGDDPYIEQTVYSTEYGYAGTFDMMTEDRTIVDLKTAKGAFDSMLGQLSAYWNATHERGDVPDAKDGAIVVLHPDPDNNPQLTPTIERLSESDMEYWFEQFCDVLEDYKAQQRLG